MRGAAEDLRLQLARLEADKRGLEMQAEALEHAHAGDRERVEKLQEDLRTAAAGQRAQVQDAGSLQAPAEQEAAELRSELRAAHLGAEEAERRFAGERKLAEARAQQGLEKLEQQISALEGQVGLEKQNLVFLEKAHEQKLAFVESSHEAALAALQGKLDTAVAAQSVAEGRQAGYTSDAAPQAGHYPARGRAGRGEAEGGGARGGPGPAGERAGGDAARRERAGEGEGGP